MYEVAIIIAISGENKISNEETKNICRKIIEDYTKDYNIGKNLWKRINIKYSKNLEYKNIVF